MRAENILLEILTEPQHEVSLSSNKNRIVKTVRIAF